MRAKSKGKKKMTAAPKKAVGFTPVAPKKDSRDGILYAHVHEDNITWAKAEAKKVKLSLSAYMDQLITFARTGK